MDNNTYDQKEESQLMILCRLVRASYSIRTGIQSSPFHAILSSPCLGYFHHNVQLSFDDPLQQNCALASVTMNALLALLIDNPPRFFWRYAELEAAYDDV
jgi:hypothetical protein